MKILMALLFMVTTSAAFAHNTGTPHTHPHPDCELHRTCQ